MDVSGAILMASAAEFEEWLKTHGQTEREIVIALFKKATGKQTVTLTALQESALCYGWIDNLGQRIDDERWAIRFVPRRPGSNWSDVNRAAVKRLLAEGRMTPGGIALLPDDLRSA